MDPLQTSIQPMASVVIDLDYSAFIQLAIVLLLMVVLKRLIFNPYLQTVEARDRKTESTRREAAELRAKADALAARYEKAFTEARAKATEARQDLRSAGLVRRDEALGEARQVASAKVDAARASVDAQFEGARRELTGHVDALAGLVVEKIIGRNA
ncbi:MAG: ATP synthase F0 subunit B [Myxococcales bacterium]|nr:ATP synthase F0 subunit B [Myxococcales bacterium]